MRYRRQFLISVVVILLAVSGCNLLGGSDEPAVEATLPEPGIGVIPTAYNLAPTLAPGAAITATPAPTVEPATGEAGGEDLAPTPLPEPTQIVPDVAPTEGPAAAPASGGGDGDPGIFIAPQLGAAEEIIVVSGVNWPPNVKVSLHWAEPGGETGPVYWEVTTDENGRFEVGLIVPPTDRWPGGEPQERDLLELRALTPSIEYQYYWATYTYIPPIDPIGSLILPFTNPDYPYSISVPNLWTWYWNEDDTTDVRFSSPGGVGYGVVLVVPGSNAANVVPGIMAQEVPGESYTTGDLSTSGYTGVEATTADGTVVQFIQSGGNIYVVSFTDDNGNPAYNILDTFTLN